jgi:hypothetical protein
MTTSIAKLEPATIKHAVVALMSGMGRSKKPGELRTRSLGNPGQSGIKDTRLRQQRQLAVLN